MDLHESKRKLDMMIMVGMSATDSILEAMRRFSYSFKNADLNKADGYSRPIRNMKESILQMRVNLFDITG